MSAKLAGDAVDKLVIVASSNAPMWISVPGGSLETLNKMDYVEAFHWLNSAMDTIWRPRMTMLWSC
jgi:hypothetical protein